MVSAIYYFHTFASLKMVPTVRMSGRTYIPRTGRGRAFSCSGPAHGSTSGHILSVISFSSALIRRGREKFHILFLYTAYKEQVMWARREVMTTYKPREGASEWNLPCQPLDLGHLASRLWNNKFQLFKPFDLQYLFKIGSSGNLIL